MLPQPPNLGTIPFGLQAFKLASCALWPFGRKIVPVEHASSAGFVV
ncbi:MAG TPA: YccF domain-containing protein [Solirubrobacteraceae bacterium]|nr:YccF domain-containing protein [Solirubrobacteraceae bacterium]